MAKAKKVATKRARFSPEELQAIRNAIIAGETPKSIHEKYGASIVNIHYHRAQLKKQGLLKPKTAASKTVSKATPKVKTAKVKTSKVATVKPSTKTAAVKPAKVVAKKAAVAEAKTSTIQLPKGPLQFVVNGVKVTVEKNAKSISVGKKSVKIEF